MKLKFLGTRGEIESRTPRHHNHSALLVAYYNTRIMLDCGEDWLDHVFDLAPDAIFITHCHPDHAWGLKNGAPCPVFATEVSWEAIGDYPIEDKRDVTPRHPLDIQGIRFEAFELEHSTRCPAVSYRVTAGDVTIHYAPDVAYIKQRAEALKDTRLYIGDGATPKHSMIRKQGDNLIGHAPIQTQLTWCQKEGVPEAIFTHCGSQIVDADERTVLAQLNEMAQQRGVEAAIAHDGLERALP